MRSLLRVFKTEPVAAKVPEVTVLFWVIKLSTTAAGEALSDWFGVKQNITWGFWIDIFMFCSALYLQFRSRRYAAWTYWYLALAIATAGTGVSDTMHLAFNLPYSVTSLFWVIVLAGVFFLWNRSEHTLDIHSITTNRREKYYWAVVFATFSLGTAVGDFAATTLGLGYLASVLLFAVIIVIPWAGWKFMNFNSVFAFWFAYVITRPIGASLADYFSKGHDVSGANLGDWQVAVVMTLVVVGLVAYTARARYDIQPEVEVAGGAVGGFAT
ncbi:MAG TPA: hypothetical protein VG244_13995 [Acidimicrobiales bacterium]|nr:hypothetical protein [Acidimicrobiales bacterium]